MGDHSLLSVPLFPGDHWFLTLEAKCNDAHHHGEKPFCPTMEDPENTTKEWKSKRQRGRLNNCMYNALKVNRVHFISGDGLR